MVSEKHQAIATEFWHDAANAVCQTMQELNACRCADGECIAARVEPQLADFETFDRLVQPLLANAEREVMRRAAEIARGSAGGYDFQAALAEGRDFDYGFYNGKNHAADSILSEITNQPGSSSLPADSAPEAGSSSSTVSGVTHSNPRLTSAGTPPVDAANCERIAQAADASPSYSEQEG